MRSINCRGKILTFDQPKIMGIVNITPDSFYEHSRNQSISAVLSTVDKMLQEGADMVDLGAFSTRPGAVEVSENEEKERLVPVVAALMSHFPDLLISVDTFRPEVARQCIDSGASLINDVSFASNKELLTLCEQQQIPYILMHMRGTPTDMMSATNYSHLVKDVYQEIEQKITQLHEIGLDDVLIDPGFGFSKTLDQNYTLLKNISFFKSLEKPILIGISRKSMVYNLLQSTPDEALYGTLALHSFAVLNGASILRVHDVKATSDVVKALSKLL